MSKDFRYTMADGTEVEAFQMDEGTRYQDGDWPDWMNARFLMTVDGENGREQWLNINDKESRIPKLGWVVQFPSGNIKAVDWSVMEEATKLVADEVVVHPRADTGISDEMLAKVAKAHGVEVDEYEAEDTTKEMGDNVKKFEPPELGAVATVDIKKESNGDVVMDVLEVSDRGLLMDCRGIYDLMRMGKQSEVNEGIQRLKDVLIDRANWCSCPPGKCEGSVSDTWDCRENSPLAK